jgi:leucyl aminopeptidase
MIKDDLAMPMEGLPVKAIITTLALFPALSFAHFNPYLYAKKLRGEDKEIFITIGADALASSQKSLGLSSKSFFGSDEEVGILRIQESQVDILSHLMHEDYLRCGGFMQHDTLEEAQEELAASSDRSFASKALFADYSITRGTVVNDLIAEVEEINIRQTIEKLSSYHNRYYKAATGIESSNWIQTRWTELAAGRSDVKVEKFVHSNWPQPSIIMTVQGSSDESIVIGGHADSISGMFGGSTAKAPGADDNASGIATMTEVIRVLLASGYQPTKTLRFMAYAAEEVGLLGSKEIAKKYKTDGAQVVGVLQLDMTNFKGTPNEDIVMMTDFTNEGQNAFLGSLIDTYLPGLKWGYDKCGYGCSDHASWNSQGYPASIPFEARMKQMNKNIHTARDTLSVSGGDASHAMKFAKLALAFVAELDK